MDTYEKKYNEALERAKKWEREHPHGYVIKDMMEYIFPELRESEDERIRKELVQFLTEIKSISEGGRDSWHVRKEDAKMCTDFLAYLERQKEQKPRLIGEDSVEKMARQMYETGQTIEEQKPAEWSEEDEKMLAAISKALGCDTAEKTLVNEGVTLVMAAGFLESLRPSWKPSEEQMEALEYVIRDYREDSCNATANYLQEILDHLKNM